MIHPAWIFLHVALLLAAYLALLISLLASVLYFVQERRLKSKRSAHGRSWLPPLEVIDQIALKSLLLGLPCMTAGLLIGCVVALETSGPSFFADPKVLLSLAMWVAYCAMIFIRRHSGPARTESGLSLELRVHLCAGGVGCQPAVIGAQVQGAMSDTARNASTLLLVGVNHTTAPLDRAGTAGDLPFAADADATRTLAHQPGIREALILSTCNRVEFLVNQDESGEQTGLVTLPQFLEEYFAVTPTSLAPHLYEFREREAIRHLFRVASSLDSMIVGEPQILGQVKQSWNVAREVGAVRSTMALPSTLDPAASASLFRGQAGAVGNADWKFVCVDCFGGGRSGAEDFRHTFRQDGADCGCGEDGGPGGATPDPAGSDDVAGGGTGRKREPRAIAEALRTSTITTGILPFAQLHEQAHRADIVITSTGAGQVFTLEHAREILQRRRNRPIFFIDIAVPRDVAPGIHEVEGCFVYDIDDLQQVAAQNQASRGREAEAG